MKKKSFDKNEISLATQQFLLALGQEERSSIYLKTPDRVANASEELFSGYLTDERSLRNGAVSKEPGLHQVLVKNIDFYSMCEHHLLPFFGKVSVAYHAQDAVLGLGRLPRIIDYYARRLQIQERLTQQISGLIQDLLNPIGSAVYIEGFHLCAAMRGGNQPDIRLVTTVYSGSFLEEVALQQVFLTNIKN